MNEDRKPTVIIHRQLTVTESREEVQMLRDAGFSNLGAQAVHAQNQFVRSVIEGVATICSGERKR